MSVFCKEQGHELWVHGLVRAEVSSEETADEVSVDRRVVSWKMYVFEISENAFEVCSQLLYLSGLACAVQSFQYYQHDVFVLVTVYKYS